MGAVKRSGRKGYDRHRGLPGGKSDQRGPGAGISAGALRRHGRSADPWPTPSRIIFPGVGAAGAAMANLRESGLDERLREWVRDGKPVLGICLGTQVIFDHSEEDDAPCLGIVPGKVRRFPAELMEDGKRLKIPHMGWNRVAFQGGPPGLCRPSRGGRVLFCPLLLSGAGGRSVGRRLDRLRHPLLRRRGPEEPRGRPVPPGEERPAGPHDPGQFLPLGRDLCSVNGSSPVSTSATAN